MHMMLRSIQASAHNVGSPHPSKTVPRIGPVSPGGKFTLAEKHGSNLHLYAYICNIPLHFTLQKHNFWLQGAYNLKAKKVKTRSILLQYSVNEQGFKITDSGSFPPPKLSPLPLNLQTSCLFLNCTNSSKPRFKVHAVRVSQFPCVRDKRVPFHVAAHQLLYLSLGFGVLNTLLHSLCLSPLNIHTETIPSNLTHGNKVSI